MFLSAFSSRAHSQQLIKAIFEERSPRYEKLTFICFL